MQNTGGDQAIVKGANGRYYLMGITDNNKFGQETQEWGVDKLSNNRQTWGLRTTASSQDVAAMEHRGRLLVPVEDYWVSPQG